MLRLTVALLPLLSVLSASASCAELVRSDVPMWSEVDDGVWPHGIVDDKTIGHGSIFMLGDWRRVDRTCSAPETSPDCESWLRLEIASVFHGGFSIDAAETRGNLDNSTGRSSLIVELRSGRRGLNLYAIQLGFMGGSEYWIASAPNRSPITNLSLLDARCDDAGSYAHRRSAKFQSHWLTTYCVVQSKRALHLMSEAAINRPPIATLEWVAQ